MNEELLIAAENGQLELFKALLKQGAQITYTDEKGNTALHRAALKNKTEIVTYILLHYPPRYLDRNNDKKTALELAQLYACHEAASELLVFELEYGDAIQQALLERASNSASTRVTSEANNLNRVTSSSHSISSSSAYASSSSSAYASSSSSAYASSSSSAYASSSASAYPNQSSRAYTSSNSSGISYSSASAIASDSIAYRSSMLNARLLGESLLISAKKRKKGAQGELTEDLATCKELIAHGADLFCIDSDGNSAVHLAAEAGNSEILRLLLSDKQVLIKFLDQKNDDEGYTPLLLAAKNGHFSVFKELLEVHKALPLERDYNGATIAHAAAFSGSIELIDYVQAHFPDLLLKRNFYDRTPLLIAVKNGQIAMVDHFSKHFGMNPFDPREVDGNGKTALLLAVENGQTAMLKHLIDNYGACLEDQDLDGNSALFIATSKGHLDTLKQLIEYGKLHKIALLNPLHAKDKMGHTILSRAIKFHKEIQHYLETEYPELKEIEEKAGESNPLRGSPTQFYPSTAAAASAIASIPSSSATSFAASASAFSPASVCASSASSPSTYFSAAASSLTSSSHSSNNQADQSVKSQHIFDTERTLDIPAIKNTFKDDVTRLKILSIVSEFCAEKEEAIGPLENSRDPSPLLHSAAASASRRNASTRTGSSASAGIVLIPDAEGNTELHRAAIEGGIFYEEYLHNFFKDQSLKEPPKNALGYTPFLMAVANGKLDIMKIFLIYNPQSAFERDNNGNSASEIADTWGQIEAFNFLQDLKRDRKGAAAAVQVTV